jgi:hypothetical protein
MVTIIWIPTPVKTINLCPFFISNKRTEKDADSEIRR